MAGKKIAKLMKREKQAAQLKREVVGGEVYLFQDAFNAFVERLKATADTEAARAAIDAAAIEAGDHFLAIVKMLSPVAVRTIDNESEQRLTAIARHQQAIARNRARRRELA